MQKIMIPPLMVGFICLFIAMFPPMTDVQHTFTTDNQGNIIYEDGTVNDTETLLIEMNGYSDGSYFGGIQGPDQNAQVGQSYYAVQSYDTTLFQIWAYDVPDSDKSVNVRLDRTSGMGILKFEFSKNTDVALTSLYNTIENNVAMIEMDLGAPYAAGSEWDEWKWYVVLSTSSSTSLATALDNGYGYNVAVQALLVNQNTGASGDFFSQDGMMVIFIAAAVIGGIAAITAFGTGVDIFGQRLIFMSATYVVLWALLSVGMFDNVIQVPIIGVVIWISLSGMYFFGVIGEMMNGGE